MSTQLTTLNQALNTVRQQADAVKRAPMLAKANEVEALADALLGWAEITTLAVTDLEEKIAYMEADNG